MCCTIETSAWILVWLSSLDLISGSVGCTVSGRALRGTEQLNAPHNVTDDYAAPEAAGAVVDSSSPAWIDALGIGTAVVLAVALVVLVIVILGYRRKTTASSPWKTGSSGQLQKAFETAVPSLRREELEAACEDFSNIIGSSPDSVVYKGTLSNGTEVAVTSISMPAANWTPNSELSFRRKVEALARMKHEHLVNLLAYCIQQEPFTRMLVFEYASNGTLFDHLHNKESEHLDWLTRMRIVMGVAYGLEYMHHELVPPASHLNFEAKAIYLTDDYAAKIANFGVAKMEVGRREGYKSKWTGTRAIGYDEWDGSDRFCPDIESNVYSFGVFMLETIAGRTPRSEPEGSLVDWAVEYLNDPKMVWYMADPSLKSYNHDELVALCKIVNLCLSPKVSKRPSMRKVSHMLADALNMSLEVTSAKVSPLLWAELQILDDS